MAGYPSIYDVTYSYTGFQQAQGDNSFPGTQLDADLAGLSGSLANIEAFIQTVFRSDGALLSPVADNYERQYYNYLAQVAGFTQSAQAFYRRAKIKAAAAAASAATFTDDQVVLKAQVFN